MSALIRRTDTELWSPPIWIDFMDLEAGSLPLDSPATQADLARHRIALQDGRKLVLYTLDGTTPAEDLLTCGNVVWLDRVSRHEVAIDTEKLVHVADLDPIDRSLYVAARARDIAAR